MHQRTLSTGPRTRRRPRRCRSAAPSRPASAAVARTELDVRLPIVAVSPKVVGPTRQDETGQAPDGHRRRLYRVLAAGSFELATPVQQASVLGADAVKVVRGGRAQSGRRKGCCSQRTPSYSQTHNVSCRICYTSTGGLITLHDSLIYATLVYSSISSP